MRFGVLALCALLAACGKPVEAPADQVATSAQPAVSAPPRDVEFFSIGELDTPEQLDSKLRGGRIADPKNWPASLYSSSVGGSCTSTLVGSQALLTAAHCVDNGAAVTFKLAGQSYRAICEHAPGYPANATVDYALCAVDKAVPNLKFERVNRDAGKLAVGKELLLTGFGCTAPDGTGGNDGIYRIGEAKIAALPSGTSNDIQTQGEVALCFGDSGGPAFLMSGSQRVQVSVNSRVSSNGGVLGDRSFLSSTSAASALAFFDDWSKRNGKPICGLDPTATSCR